MPQEVFQHTFPNGLTLLAEPMPHVRSAALNFLLPAGCVYDRPDRLGAGAVLADLITRGAGDRDSRELTLAMDNLGLDSSESVGSVHMRFWGATVGRNLPAALELYADILLRPHLPEDELDAVRSLALQDIRGLEDEPRSKVLVELRKRHYPSPLGNDHRGTVEGVSALTIEDIRQRHKRLFRPGGAILAVAGNFEWAPLMDQVERLFGDWRGDAPTPPAPGQRGDKRGHVAKDLAQTQIAVAYASVPVGDPDYYAAMGAVHVLSGGMSSRLFTEVREKRALCYSVWASYQTFKDRASVIAYAGTTNERAQETLEVLLGELRRLPDGDRIGRGGARAGRPQVVAHHAAGIHVGPRPGVGLGLVQPRPRAQLRRDPVGGQRPDAGEHPGPRPPSSAGRLHHRHPRPQAVGDQLISPQRHREHKEEIQRAIHI